MEDISHFKPKMHVFVCINERESSTPPSCGPEITNDQVKEVKRWIIEQSWAKDVYCTKVKCLGFCNPEGGVMCVYPSGRFVKGIKNVEDIKKIILEEIGKI